MIVDSKRRARSEIAKANLLDTRWLPGETPEPGICTSMQYRAKTARSPAQRGSRWNYGRGTRDSPEYPATRLGMAFPSST
jgi:hypothetical protein